jgi:ribulose-phosphate 3-epimerase
MNDSTSTNVIIPGILVHTKAEFDERLSEIRGFSDVVHVDFADGVYVPNTLVDIAAIDPIPDMSEVEAHLMVHDPISYFEACALKGFTRVIVHWDALREASSPEAVFARDQAMALGLEFTLAFKKGIPIELSDTLQAFSRIMIMTIDPGFSGSPFVADQLEVIRSVRVRYPSLDIEVDGHVTDETVPLIRDAGATYFVSTSYLSGEDILEHYDLLQQLLH